MKHFMKSAAVTAAIMIILGLAIAIPSCYVVGADMIENTVDEVTDGKVHINLDPNQDFFGITTPRLSFFNHKGSDDTVFSEGPSQNLGKEITGLVLDCGACEFRQEISEDEYFYLTSTGDGKFEINVDGSGVLHISYKNKNKNMAINSAYIIFYVPEGRTFDKVELAAGAGDISFTELRAEKVTAEIGAGNMTVNRLSVDKLETQLGAGSLHVDNCEIREKAEVDCALGDVTIDMIGAYEDYDYEIEAAMGNVTIGDNSYSGVGRKQTIDNNSDISIEVECAMGNVTLSFQ